MAGDWIKFDKTTPDKEEVFDMATDLGIDPDAVVGKLLRVWSWFDDHTEDGNASVTVRALLDRNAGVTGFVDAAIKVNWIAQTEGKLTIVNFERHNGKTAKNRAMTALRVAKSREKKSTCNDNVTQDVTLSPLPKSLPEKRREEKSREENNREEKRSTTTTSTEKAYDVPQIENRSPEVVVDSKISLGSFLRIAEKFEIHPGFAEAIWIDQEEAHWVDAKGVSIVSPALFLKSAWDAAQAKQEQNKGSGEREGWKVDADIARITKEIQSLQDNPGSRNSSLGFTKSKGDHFEQYEDTWLDRVSKIHDEAVEKQPAEIAELEVLIEENKKGIEGEVALEAFNDPGYRLTLYAESFDTAPDFEEWDKDFNKPNTWRDPKGLTPTALVELRALKQSKTKLEAELSRVIREN